ncbi:MAG TPA: N-acetylmuramoyl-L-alanine amidase [Methylomirabilota bacterium]|nr:N-acetylmuramoyl-L-alanine amidase [Methylomirabilota bacterium]
MALVIAACAPLAARRELPPPWAPLEAALPPIPFRDGLLALTLVHPPEGGEITVRDRTFVFGTAGTGRARVAINGAPVDVAPNGAFLAFLPVPADGVYRAEARVGEEHAEVIRRVRVPETPAARAHGEAFIDEPSVFPRGAWAAMPGEPIEVGFRGTAGGEAVLVLGDGSRIPLVEQAPVVEVPWGRRSFGAVPPSPEPAIPGLVHYRGMLVARPLLASEPDVPRPALAPLPTSTRSGAAVELKAGGHVVRVPLRLNLALLDPEQPAVGVVHEPDDARRSTGVDAAAGPASTYHYFWDNGTRLTLTGEQAGEYRVRLTPDLHAWVAADRVRLLPPGTPPPRGRVGTVRLTPRPEAVAVRIEVDRPLPYRVESRGSSVAITIYGGFADTRWLMSGGLDRHVIGARWSQPADGLWVLTLDLAQPHWGHSASWDPNGDLVVRVRRPPPLDRRRPLRGLVVAVDPGHPPGGATGPTGLGEAEVNLAVALRLARMLERAGARVILTRTDDTALGLDERARIAEVAGAHLFVSLHQNAFPDGVDPFVDSGTSTFYFHPHAAALARALQAELIQEFRLRDLGVGRASLAVLRRVTWMPAALTETMFMMMPPQEAALRDPDVQERIARAHLRGLERFLREQHRASRSSAAATAPPALTPQAAVSDARAR